MPIVFYTQWEVASDAYRIIPSVLQQDKTCSLFMGCITCWGPTGRFENWVIFWVCAPTHARGCQRYQSASWKPSSLPTVKAMKCDSWQGLVTEYNRRDHVGLSVLVELYRWLPVDLISLGLWFTWIIYSFLRCALTKGKSGEAYIGICELKYLTCLQAPPNGLV